MSVFKTSICLFVFRLLFFPMISPWYVPLSSQPRPYHKSNTGKHGGKKLACEKCIFMNYWPGDFTCVVLAFVVHSPRCLQASKRGACTMENKVLQRSGSMLARPKYPVVATSAQKVSAFILLDFLRHEQFFCIRPRPRQNTEAWWEQKHAVLQKHPWFQHRWMRSPICVACTFLRYPKMPKTICFCAFSSKLISVSILNC